MPHPQFFSHAESSSPNVSPLVARRMAAQPKPQDKLFLEHIESIQNNPCQSINYSLFACAYVSFNATEKIDLLNLLISLKPNRESLLQFSEALSKTDVSLYIAFPRFLYNMKPIGNDHKNRSFLLDCILFLLQSDLYKSEKDELLHEFAYREYVKLYVLELLNFQTDRLLSKLDSLNPFKTSPDLKITATELLKNLIGDENFRSQTIKNSHRANYWDVITHWLQEEIAVSPSKTIKIADVIRDERNILKKTGLFSKTPSDLELTIKAILKDYGNVYLSEDYAAPHQTRGLFSEKPSGI